MLEKGPHSGAALQLPARLQKLSLSPVACCSQWSITFPWGVIHLCCAVFPRLFLAGSHAAVLGEIPAGSRLEIDPTEGGEGRQHSSSHGNVCCSLTSTSPTFPKGNWLAGQGFSWITSIPPGSFQPQGLEAGGRVGSSPLPWCRQGPYWSHQLMGKRFGIRN